jgi:hypothetical protein
MRLILPNGISYDLNAMFTPKKIGRAEAWQRFKNNLRALPKAAALPLNFPFKSQTFVNWMLVFTLHIVSLGLLPLLFLFGYSMKSYVLVSSKESKDIDDYRVALKAIYQKHKHIDDIEEYKRLVSEDIALLKSKTKGK